MPDEEIDWNECLPFTGPEAKLPLGVLIPGHPNLTIKDFVLDTKKSKKGKIIDVVIDEELYKEIAGPDGSGVLIVDALGHGNQTREEFYATHGQTDGLKSWALRTVLRTER